ncbi:hypothetical protein BaRGS_00012693 [Batillaria attramentaria]|uniref:Uncharacterized protein n=1 Tax=Batillaria attramentaria TaxID=370345 RepID=A0ABD0L915_9CAEN
MQIQTVIVQLTFKMYAELTHHSLEHEMQSMCHRKSVAVAREYVNFALYMKAIDQREINSLPVYFCCRFGISICTHWLGQLRLTTDVSSEFSTELTGVGRFALTRRHTAQPLGGSQSVSVTDGVEPVDI